MGTLSEIQYWKCCHKILKMYVCVCNAITEKMLEENHFLIAKIGYKCGKCLVDGVVDDGNQVKYLKSNSDLNLESITIIKYI